MKNAVKIISNSFVLLAATLLSCITAAFSLSPWLYLLSAFIFLAANIAPNPFRKLPSRLKAEEGGFVLLSGTE